VLQSPVVVRTRSGAVRGRADDRVGVRFRGIPYAAPPFGAHRFGAPAPVPPWDGVLDAADFGPRPPQPPRLPAEPSWTQTEGLGCLTINVHTPGGDGGLPVVVWIYGGAYMSGHAGDPSFDGTRLVAEGVVFVTFNYRVGFEGFGHVPGSPANRGLLDQLAALAWVQDNIAGFGGDPGKVTVVGQSAGAGSAIALATMPRARGLFRRAVAQSVPGLFFSHDMAVELAGHVARVAALDAGAGRDAWVALAPDQLVTAGQVVTLMLRNRPDRWGMLGHANTPFAPVVDGEVLRTSPIETIRGMGGGGAGQLDLLVGFTRDEYRSFMFESRVLGRPSEGDARLAAANFGLPRSAIDEYRRAHPGINWADLYALICSDGLFRVPSIRTADNHAAVSAASKATSTAGRTYLYEFAWPTPAADGVLGACHAIDVPFVFGTFDSPFARAWIGADPGAGANELSRRMRRSWLGFVTTGDPGWPAYESGSRRTKVWADTDAVVPDPEEVSRHIWANHAFGELPSVGIRPIP
jgi:para-nitrobenzyl esterase